MRHIVMDMDTGLFRVQGRDHKLYTIEQVDAADRRAQAGDPEAVALVESLEIDAPGGQVNVHDLLHDCPDCRAALARGEQPWILDEAELKAIRRRVKKPVRRWRAQKRRG